ncbi:hypothetical protein JNK13_08085 [bacterium]|nr:hypothetical protein [bacterium]
MTKNYEPALRHLEKVLEGKKELKKQLIALPFAEKIRRIIEMQKFAAAIRKPGSKPVFIWELE